MESKIDKLMDILFISSLILAMITVIVILFKVAFTPEVKEASKNQIVIEMDKSCFTQFQNNMDKTIFVKLYFKQ